MPPKKNYNLPLVNVLVISLLLHVVAGLVVGSVVIARSFTEEEKEFKPPPKITKVEPKKIQYKQDVKKQQKDSAPPRPDPIQVPTPDNLSVPDISVDISGTSPNVEVGQGTGAGSGLGNGFEQSMSDFEMTAFGATGEAEGLLRGVLIDLKQTDDEERSGADYEQTVLDFINQNDWSEDYFDDFFIADTELFAAFYMTRHMEAAEAPAAFNAEDEVQPQQWVALYQGQARLKKGRYRFVGAADDIMIVRVNGEIVFNGSRDIAADEYAEWTQEGEDEQGGRKSVHNNQMHYGDWFRIRSQPTQMEVLVGEWPGGKFNMALYIQDKSDEGDRLEEGEFADWPNVSVFTSRKLNSDQYDMIEENVQGEIPTPFNKRLNY